MSTIETSVEKVKRAYTEEIEVEYRIESKLLPVFGRTGKS